MGKTGVTILKSHLGISQVLELSLAAMSFAFQLCPSQKGHSHLRNELHRTLVAFHYACGSLAFKKALTCHVSQYFSFMDIMHIINERIIKSTLDQKVGRGGMDSLVAYF